MMGATDFYCLGREKVMGTPNELAPATPKQSVLARVAEEVKADVVAMIKADERYAPVVAQIIGEFFSAFGL